MYEKERILSYTYLGLGIVAETIATSCLKYTKEFTKLFPTMGVLALYAAGLFFLTLCLRIIPVGIAYAIWAGMGIVLVSIFSYFIFKQTLDIYAIIGIALILLGLVVIHLFSKSITH